MRRGRGDAEQNLIRGAYGQKCDLLVLYNYKAR